LEATVLANPSANIYKQIRHIRLGYLTAKQGKFIVLEGLDGSGISTQAVALESHLRKLGLRTMHTKEPTERLMGGLLKEALKGEWTASSEALQLLFCADRANHVKNEIEPALSKGRMVVCDRYLFSTLAYGFSAGVDFQWLCAVNRVFRLPDLTIFIDIPADISLSRIKSGRERRELFEKRESLNKVRKAYLNLAKRYRFKVVNGDQSMTEVSKDIEEVVDSYLRREHIINKISTR